MIVNAADYGLSVYASSDTNTRALQSAVDAAGTLGKIYIPKGTFYIGPVRFFVRSRRKKYMQRKRHYR